MSESDRTIGPPADYKPITKYELWAMEAQARAIQCEDLLAAAHAERDAAVSSAAELADTLRDVRASLRSEFTDHGSPSLVEIIDAALAKNPVVGAEAEKAEGARAPEDAYSAAQAPAANAEMPGSGPAGSHNGTIPMDSGHSSPQKLGACDVCGKGQVNLNFDGETAYLRCDACGSEIADGVVMKINLAIAGKQPLSQGHGRYCANCRDSIRLEADWAVCPRCGTHASEGHAI